MRRDREWWLLPCILAYGCIMFVTGMAVGMGT